MNTYSIDKKRKALAIVCHPDDEVLWCGGYILRHLEYEWKIIAVCCGNNSIRNEAFIRSCHELGVNEYQHINFNDKFVENDLENILKTINFNDFEIIITHDEIYGEYGKEDHKMVGKVVNRLVKGKTARLMNFSYKNFQYPQEKIDKSDTTRIVSDSQEFPSVEGKEADVILFLTHEELRKKLSILQNVYSGENENFKNLSWPCPNPEAFRNIDKK